MDVNSTDARPLDNRENHQEGCARIITQFIDERCAARNDSLQFLGVVSNSPSPIGVSGIGSNIWPLAMRKTSYPLAVLARSERRLTA